MQYRSANLESHNSNEKARSVLGKLEKRLVLREIFCAQTRMGNLGVRVKQSRECRRDVCDMLPFWAGAMRVLLSVKNGGWLWGFTVGWIRGED